MLRRPACFRACHLSPQRATRFCFAAAGCACPSMLKHREICNSNLGTNPSLHLRPRGFFLTRHFSFFFAKIADDRQQTTCGEHNATTLPHSTAAVGNTIYVRVACPRYAVASCLCRSLPFVTPPYHTFLLCYRRVHVSIDAET